MINSVNPSTFYYSYIIEYVLNNYLNVKICDSIPILNIIIINYNAIIL